MRWSRPLGAGLESEAVAHFQFLYVSRVLPLFLWGPTLCIGWLARTPIFSGTGAPSVSSFLVPGEPQPPTHPWGSEGPKCGAHSLSSPWLALLICWESDVMMKLLLVNQIFCVSSEGLELQSLSPPLQGGKVSLIFFFYAHDVPIFSGLVQRCQFTIS